MTDRGNHEVGRVANGKVGTLDIVLRGMFLACSWTWCIGMFFPVFFIGDFGVWGWVAFAVPNVIGAGAMGWVLRRPGASEWITRDHPVAARCFSLVTVLFHVAFGIWFWDLFADQFNTLYVGGALVLLFLWLVGVGLAELRDRPWAWVTCCTFAVSMSCAIAAFTTSDTLAPPPVSGRHSSVELLMTLPVLVFGFGLCPYLDLTFHRVRRETPGSAGVWAFVVGFVCFFLPMIVLTLFYASAFITGARVSLFIACHVMCQAVFTVAAHTRELLFFQDPRASALDSERSVNQVNARRLVRALTFVVILAALFILMFGREMRPDYPTRRLVYEIFMSFYALVFPAYVWIVIIERGLTRRVRLALYGVALALASPCLWLGYIEQRYLWLLPGVAIPLVIPYLGKLLRAPSASLDLGEPDTGHRQKR